MVKDLFTKLWRSLQPSEQQSLDSLLFAKLVTETNEDTREILESQLSLINRRIRSTYEVMLTFPKKRDARLFANQGEIFKLFSATVRENSQGETVEVFGTVFKGYLSTIGFRHDIPVRQQQNGDWEVVDLKIYAPPKASPSERRLDLEKVADILGAKPGSAELSPSRDVYANLVDDYEASLNAEHLEFLRVCGGADLELLTLRGIGDLQFFPSSPAIVVGDVADGLLIWHEGCYREWCFDGTEQRVLTAELKSSIQLLKT